ncbi:hypothetical protein ABPG74_010917 [Tetrahymena malaccensis]
MDINSPQLQKAVSISQQNKNNIKDQINSPQGVSPNQQYNFTAQNLNIFVQHYDEQPNLVQEIQLIQKNKDYNEFINADIAKFKSDQLSLIQENISENTPQTFSSNSQNSPSKIASKFSSISVDIQDFNDPRLGAIKRGKLFTLTDLESFGGRNKKDLEEIVPLTEEVENKSGQINISKQLAKINSNTYIKENTQQKRKTIQSKTHRSHVVTIRTPDMIWKQKFFFIMSYVSRMVMKMKQVKIFRHPELLFETQLNAINDKAAKDISDDNWGQKDNKFIESLQMNGFQKYTNVNKRNKYKYILKRYKLFRKSFRQKMRPLIQCISQCTTSFQKYISAMFKKIQTFDSTSIFILVWSNFIFLLTLCISIYLPYEYCFNITREYPTFITLNIIMPVIFFLNIVVISNTTYFEKGNVINGHAQIFLKYLKNYFFIDIISTISFFMPSGSFLMFLFFFRWFVYKNFLSKQTERLLLYSSVLTYINIIKLLAQILFICHLGSCFWYKIGYNQLKDSQNGWLYQAQKLNELQSQQNIDLYLLSTLTIISNLTFFQQRYSQIFLSRQEAVYLVAMSILGISLFAYLLYEVRKILKVLDKRREEYLKQLKSLSNYMSTHEVDPYLRERSRKYLEFMYSEEQEQQWSTQESLNSLSNYLKQEIIKDVFMKAVKKIQLFRKFFSWNPKFLEKLALRSKEISFGPDELIMRQGNVEIPSLYIVTHGEIQLFVEMGSFAHKQQKLFKKVQANQCFGMYEFFSSNYEVQLSAKSLGVSRMLCITLNEMLELLREFPKEREAFCYLKDLITFKQDLSQIGLSCYSCNQVNHYVLDCPYLFYGTQPQKVIKEINKQIKHTILNFKRSAKRKKVKSILQSYLISHKAQIFQEKFLNMLESLEQEQYSSDTSIQFLGETSQYSSYNDVETHTLNQSRFDRKSILRVHSGSSKFTARHKHKDSESQKSHIGSRLDQSKEEKEGTYNRGRPSSVSISKFGRLVKISDVSVGQHGEEPSELKSAFSWNTKDRRVSLSNNYELNTVGRINSAEFFNNEDSKRIFSMLRRSESDQHLSYDNILDKCEQEDDENQSLRRNEKRHSTNKTNKTNKTNRTNKTSKTTITKTLQQLDMDGSLNSLHQSNKSNSISSNGQIEIDKNVNQIKFSNMDINNNISPIHNPRKESQNSNSMYNNNSSNIINQLYQLPSSSMNNNIPPTSSLNALNNAINLGNQQSSIPVNSINSAVINSNLVSNLPSSQNPQQSSIINDKIQGSNQNNQPGAVGPSAQNTANNSVNHSNSLNQNNTIPKDTNNTYTQKQNSNLNQQRSLSITQQTPSQKFTQQFSIYPIENRFSQRSHQPIESIQSYSVSIGTVKSFELYFPQNNVENIIERYNKLQRKKVSRRVRKKRTTQRRETKKRSHLTTFVSNRLIEEAENRHIHQTSGYDIDKMNSSIGTVNIQSNSAIPYRPPSKKDIFNLNTFNLNDNIQSLNKPNPQIISLK